jgi:hypothetical protein
MFYRLHYKIANASDKLIFICAYCAAFAAILTISVAFMNIKQPKISDPVKYSPPVKSYVYNHRYA